jgi:N-acetylneuraminic acid mutarotase
VLVILFLTSSCIVLSKSVSGDSMVENSWVEMAPMHVARADLGIATVDGKIYAIGGTTQTPQGISIPNTSPAGESPVGTNEQYNPETNTWIFKAPMPDPRVGFAIATFQGKIYCIGGVGNNRATEVYNPINDTWESKAPIPKSFSPVQATIINGKIYVIGGSTFGKLDNYVYDPSTDSWTMKTPIPDTGAYWGFVSTGANNKMYALGGINILSGGAPYGIYNPETDNWSIVNTPPLTVASGGAVATTGVLAPIRIYLIGAQPGVEEKNTPSFPTQVYDPSTGSWAMGATMTIGRNDFGMANINDSLYVIGGYTFGSSKWMNYTVLAPPMTPSAANEKYLPLGYGNPDPYYVLLNYPPKIEILSILIQTKNVSIPLVFTEDKAVSWTGYSLDGQQNVTIIGNTTLTGLSSGQHNIIVYANDTYGNIGASQPVNFTIAKPEPFPILLVAAISGTIAITVAAGLLVYFKKHRRAA